MKNILILLAVLSLTACAGRWTEKTCAETNFSDLGYQEGSAGQNSRLNSYNQACLKKKIQIPTADYDAGYKKGLKVFCSSSKGLNDGASGNEMVNNCRSIPAYTTAHKKGLRSFCSTEKGVQDGFAMRSEVILCTSFSAYTTGYAKGKREFCSSDKGHEDGFKGLNMDSRCVQYSSYKSGFSKGKKYFCSPENGTKVGKRGDDFPKQCTSSLFKKNYNKGRTVFLRKVLRDKETSISFERQNYERIRDDLQDTQFALSRLPKYSTDPAVSDEKARIDKQITSLQTKRDRQRRVIEDLESQVYDIKNELSDLRQ